MESVGCQFMPSPKIKTIIFDFGKVIGNFDFQPTLDKLLPHSKLTQEEIFIAIRESNLEHRYETGAISSDEFLHQFCAVCQLSCSADVVAAAWTDIFWPNDDVCKLIPQLSRNYRLQLGSNTNDLHARRFLDQFADVLSHFAALSLSHQVGYRKPHGGFYQHCVDRSGHAAEECLFIDDLPANVQGAKDAGLQSLLYSDIQSLHAEFEKLGITY